MIINARDIWNNALEYNTDILNNELLDVYKFSYISQDPVKSGYY